MTRDGESTDDDEDGQDEDDGSSGTQVPEADAVITPIGGQVLCGEYRWRRVKAITNDL
jgi:hypothetical protein